MIDFKLQNFHVFLLIAITICSCNNTRLSEWQQEEKIFYEVFPAIIDSIQVQPNIPSPAPLPIFDVNKNLVVFDTISYNKKLAQHKIEIAELNLDTSKWITAIADSLFIFNSSWPDDLLTQFQLSGNSIDILHKTQKHKINLNKLKDKSNNKLEYRYRSKFPNGHKIWKTEYDFHFAGAIGFSRIHFNKNKTFGVLDSYYSRGSLWGQGIRVYIQYKNKKWHIYNIVETWVS